MEAETAIKPVKENGLTNGENGRNGPELVAQQSIDYSDDLINEIPEERLSKVHFLYSHCFFNNKCDSYCSVQYRLIH